jgi:hypothetical protein
MHRACRLIVIAFALLYALALGLFVVGTFGLFGSPSGPLAGVFLMPLGLPWNQMLDVFPEPLGPMLVILAPALNLVILVLICRWGASKRSAQGG